MNVLLQAVELGLAEIVPIENLVSKLRDIFKLNPDAKLNIQNLASDALQADADTMKLVADWKKSKGLS